jgi:hypothetical protein
MWWKGEEREKVMKDNTKKKAPRQTIPSKKKPLSPFRESDKMIGNKSPMSPLKGKRLSK